MKIAIYKDIFGEDIEIAYDEDSPCRICGLPVIHASMGGTDVCPYCDLGIYRDGTRMNIRELTRTDLLKNKAKKIYEELGKKQEEFGKKEINYEQNRFDSIW